MNDEDIEIVDNIEGVRSQLQVPQGQPYIQVQQPLPRRPAYGDEEVVQMLDAVEQILKNFCAIYPTYTSSNALLYLSGGIAQRGAPQ